MFDRAIPALAIGLIALVCVVCVAITHYQACRAANAADKASKAATEAANAALAAETAEYPDRVWTHGDPPGPELGHPDDETVMYALPRCRTCSVPIEPNPGADATQYPWRHRLSLRPACWLLGTGERIAQFFGSFAEPLRTCAACGTAETEADPLVGSKAMQPSTYPVQWYCTDVVACANRRAARIPPCPCGTGHPVGRCPGKWHFEPAPVGSER